jgi:hypothetical protein
LLSVLPGIRESLKPTFHPESILRNHWASDQKEFPPIPVIVFSWGRLPTHVTKRRDDGREGDPLKEVEAELKNPKHLSLYKSKQEERIIVKGAVADGSPKLFSVTSSAGSRTAIDIFSPYCRHSGRRRQASLRLGRTRAPRGAVRRIDPSAGWHRESGLGASTRARPITDRTGDHDVGLQLGDRVALTDVDNLADGMKVTAGGRGAEPKAGAGKSGDAKPADAKADNKKTE